MLRHGIVSIRSSNVRSWSRVVTTDSVQFTSSHSRISSPIRFYSQKPHKTTFNRGTPGETSARAPRPSFATNLVTFLAVSSLSVGGALYQWNKTRQGDIFSALSSSSEGLTNEKWTPILLTKITPVSAETSLFEFQLPRPCIIPVSSAIYVKDDEIQAMRAYTPVHSTEREQETFQLLIKRYSEGQVSRFMHAAKPGKKVEMRGPVVIWPGGRQDLEQWDEIGMIAGGTGITAMLPIIHTALTNPAKKTKISLLFAAQSPEELYFKDELDQLAKSFSGQFTVRYAVDKAPLSEGEWSGYVGYVNQGMLRGLLPASKAITGATDATTSAGAQVAIKSVVLVCGPESMIRHVAGNRGASGQEQIRGVLGEMGYKKDQVFRFPN